MITGITIQNFKGVRDPVEIKLAPITLLFGPNSAGKSSVLHALHYAKEILERGNLDADRTVTGGDFVDLGGFANFVHDHNLQRAVGLRFELEMGFELSGDDEMLQGDFGWSCLPLMRINTLSVDLTIAWSQLAGQPQLLSYTIGADGMPIATLRRQAGRPDVELANVHWWHPIFEWHASSDPNDLILDVDELKDAADSMVGEPKILEVLYRLATGTHDPLPSILAIANVKSPLPTDMSLALLLEGATDESERRYEQIFNEVVRSLFANSFSTLQAAVDDLRYLGPLRAAPRRQERHVRVDSESRWADGRAAWDLLFTEPEEFVEQVNSWLAGEDRLNIGYSVRRRQYKEFDLSDPFMLALSNGTALDRIEDFADSIARLPTRTRLVLVDARTGLEVDSVDVGEGVSQVLPIAVALLSRSGGPILMEQPELHVHPQVQVAIGDLLIEHMHQRLKDHTDPSSAPPPVIIETHSEHLLLRLLRRIRETAARELPAGALPLTPEHLSVVYLEKIDGAVRATPLRVDETGEFIDRWPHGFFDERAKELF